MFQHHYLSWVFLLILMGLLLYTAIKIKTEKKFAKDYGKNHRLENLTFSVPPWWSIKESRPQLLIFYRADTFYEWFFSAQLIDSPMSVATVLQQKKIKLDPQGHAFSEVQKNVLPPMQLPHSQFLIERIEGSGTQDEERRVYIDLTLIVEINNNNHYLFYSESSILNGSVEGPFVDDLLSTIVHSCCNKET